MRIDRRSTLCAMMLAATAACHPGTTVRTPVRTSEADLTHAQRLGADRVRNATDAFHDHRVALAAGYTTQYPAGCAASSDGAQGIHYLNKKLVDANVDLLHPELLMYEPQTDGDLQLVGVDYIVPFAEWKSETPPRLLGVPFMRNEPLGVWALHIWAWRYNSSGTFAMWNPGVTCPPAPSSIAAHEQSH